ncbi:MAG TPA: glycosyltransferase family 39 protein [Longimicrobiales bacterium]|nr:glycosyltransferase family 39 protein [Longimicrobiales bacterium]
MIPVDTAPAPVEAMPAAHSRWRAVLSGRPVLWLTLAAIALRLVIFLGRGDYVAFDEGWYLLLARSLFDGQGYSLTGLRHVTLSPLFPILAGAVAELIGDPIRAGRLVAAVAAGLLVWPCWSIFNRLTDRRTAWLACVFVAVMPALAPFAAPYWIGWDLWVGAEPLLHVFLFAGIALALRGWREQRTADWAAAGLALALAYLARSEAILPFGMLGLLLTARALWLRTPRAMLNVAVLALAFAVTAAPYWLYLHDAMGRWTITGRGVEVVVPRRATDAATAAESPPPGSAATGIERMLWEEGQRSYMYSLYALDASATHLASSYWGIPDEDAAATQARNAAVEPTAPRAGSPAPVADAASPAAAQNDTLPGRWTLYVRALTTAIPWYLWPFIGVGLFGMRRAWRDELVVAVPLVLTSVAIARIVAADPRTQLFIVPLAAFYAARGVTMFGAFVDDRIRDGSLRRGFVATATAAILAFVLLATEARWVYLGLSLGSPHHLVGSANRRMGEALRDIVPEHEPVMSWHPAIALYARRDWRVLPHASFDNVVRYANATDTRFLVLSQYYPPQGILGELPREHLVLDIPPGAAAAGGQFRLELSDAGTSHMFGTVQPAVGVDPPDTTLSDEGS